MRTSMVYLTIVLVLSLFISNDVSAQRGMRWRGSSGWGQGGQYQRLYDVKTVESIAGEVLRIDRITPMKGMSAGIHLVLKEANGEMSVHLGPEWYIEHQDFEIKVGDKIEVTGSKVMFQGKPAVIAAEVKKNHDVLKLRDGNGFPFWAGRYQR
jgi:hypothetical protein